MSQLVDAKDHISRECESILTGSYNVCLVTVIGLDKRLYSLGLDSSHHAVT